jgi:hypothetical protein
MPAGVDSLSLISGFAMVCLIDCVPKTNYTTEKTLAAAVNGLKAKQYLILKGIEKSN